MSADLDTPEVCAQRRAALYAATAGPSALGGRRPARHYPNPVAGRRQGARPAAPRLPVVVESPACRIDVSYLGSGLVLTSPDRPDWWRPVRSRAEIADAVLELAQPELVAGPPHAPPAP